MRNLGTIDEAGFRADLQSASQNDYPRLQLVKLPFNWFVPNSGGIVQAQMGGSGTYNAGLGAAPQSVLVPNTKHGNALLILANVASFPDPTGTLSCTDSDSNSYTFMGSSSFSFSNDAVCAVWLATGINGGSVTVTINQTSGGGLVAIHAYEIGGVTGVRGTSFGNFNSCGPVAAQPGDLAVAFGAGRAGDSASLWTSDSGWTTGLEGPDNVAQNAYNCAFSVTQKIAAAGNVSQHLVFSEATNNSTNVLVVLEGDFNPSTAGVPAPVTPIPLGGSCNFLALVSEAIDEQGNYLQSALLGQQAAAGYVRLNGQGNVWIPLSFASPLTPGYVTTNDNYRQTPIVGTGFSSLEAPFGQLDFQPASPVFYTGPEPTDPAGYLLAFVGINVGVGSDLGNGTGSTYGIPSAAGPLERLKKAGIEL